MCLCVRFFVTIVRSVSVFLCHKYSVIVGLRVCQIFVFVCVCLCLGLCLCLWDHVTALASCGGASAEAGRPQRRRGSPAEPARSRRLAVRPRPGSGAATAVDSNGSGREAAVWSFLWSFLRISSAFPMISPMTVFFLFEFPTISY